ncbi:MAG: benzoate/H(+) symporter BenE family transporter [Burkholderiaceae bacterium]|nr:benzoate/H(+) symporter BenE family transporter [Burkholderiaceae bacterium]
MAPPDARRHPDAAPAASESPIVSTQAGASSERASWLAEASGAFGDLGVLIPFVTAYLGVVGMAPTGVLVPIGLASLAAGLWYRTPFPVQPMKLIGASVILYAGSGVEMTPTVVVAAGLCTGLIWLALGLTGLAARLSALIPREAMLGVVMGLGFGFMLEGLRAMSATPVASGLTLAVAMVLLSRPTIPTMLVLLFGGATASLLGGGAAAFDASRLVPALTLPTPAWPQLSWHAAELGLLLLALPQLPLTFGNALFAVVDENNRRFPDRPTHERTVALSTGLMNLLSSALGGIPLCHGTGGMAAQVRFGARSGRAPLIFGATMLAIGLFFADAVSLLFALVPAAVLGSILFLAGLQLALGSRAEGGQKAERFVVLATAGIAVWHAGLAVLFGVLAHHAAKRGWVRL